MNRFRSTQGLRKNSRVSCYAQELVNDVFGHKTGIAGCHGFTQKVHTKLVFRTGTVRGIKQNIGVND
jgi:hypothetical protein